MSRLLSLISFLLPVFLFALEEKPFVIIIPSANKENLKSVLEQKYHNYRVIYIDDDSAREPTYQQDARFTLIKNPQKRGALACMVQAIFQCNKNEIIVDLDGSARLSHNEVLSDLNSLYADPDVWMTCAPPQDSIRLSSFYAALFHEIDKGDFLHEGKFIQTSPELAYTLPILQMAGKHSCFAQVSASDKGGMEINLLMQSRKPYKPLDELPPAKSFPYGAIEDPLHPTNEDYFYIQTYLSYGERKNIERLGDCTERVRKMVIIGENPEEKPQSDMISVNCSPDERENCIMLYSSFNDKYPRGLKRLLKLISESNFKGHVLYRLGGWPDVEGGSLPLAHVPYAFKVAFFNEAKRLGFKRALWLDTAVIPIASLNTIFEMIKEKGCFVMSNGLMASPYINATAAAYFGLSLDQTQEIPSCAAGLFGVDFTNKVGSEIIERWYRAAFDKDAFFSPRSDQSALSIILYQMGIGDFISLDRLPHTEIHDEVKPDSLFLLDRGHIW